MVRKRLNSWSHSYVSLGGKVILINSMLNGILVFFLSYLKMLMKVWKKLIRIHRRFFWGWVKEISKVLWVRWS